MPLSVLGEFPSMLKMEANVLKFAFHEIKKFQKVRRSPFKSDQGDSIYSPNSLRGDIYLAGRRNTATNNEKKSNLAPPIKRPDDQTRPSIFRAIFDGAKSDTTRAIESQQCAGFTDQGISQQAQS